MTFLAFLSGVDFQSEATKLIVTMAVLAGAVFVLGSAVLRQGPVSSSSSARAKCLPRQDSPAAHGPTNDPSPLERIRLERSLSVPAQPDPNEKRGSLRREGNPVEIVLTEEASPGKQVPGLVVNRSRGGLCVSLEQPMTVGAVISVRAVHAPDDVPPIQIRMQTCRRREDHWELGCQFVEKLPWSVLLLFG